MKVTLSPATTNIDCDVMKHRRMIAIGLLFLRMLCDWFKPQHRLEAEILILRHQLNVLQRYTPRRLQPRWADRALFIWLYRRHPRQNPMCYGNL